MKPHLAFIFITTILFSCQQQHSNSASEFGAVDADAIAADTAMQLGIESSYEYHQTLLANDTLVYDIIGYKGANSQYEFAILKRTAGNRTDTLVKQISNGTIANAVINDLNSDGVKEIYIVTRNNNSGNFSANVFAYMASYNFTPIAFSEPFTTNHTKGYSGFDSVFFQRAFLVRRYPVFVAGDSVCATCATGGYRYIYYKLQQGKILVAQTEIVP